ERRADKGISEQEANAAARKPLNFAALLVALGDADGCLGGAVNTTGETVRAVLTAIGPAPGIRTISGAFLMLHRERHMTFADCAVVVEPTPGQLADIAIAAARTTKQFFENEPVVALLSYSTKGSAAHACIDTVTEALRLVREREPELRIDGEL